MATDIIIKPIKDSKISNVDFSNLPFGKVFSDHIFQCEYIDGAWQNPIIKPNEPILLNPAAKIFHYGQSIFEGMKAYKDGNGEVFLFRPEENCKRLNLSAKRLMMPEIPADLFMDGLKKLLEIDSDWIPTTEGSSLYVRPFMFASGEGLHASPADSYTFIISTAPSGAYFSGKVTVLIEEKYARAANGGVGFAKAGGNYAAQFYPTQLAIEKGYNQVIWTDDNSHQFIEEAGNDDETIMVRFKDYGFFMPLDAAGKEVIVAGKAFVNEVSVADLKHYAEDAGKSSEEIANITEPAMEFAFEANGVLLKK